MSKLTLKPGTYTLEELLKLFEFNIHEEAKIEHESGSHTDFRRVQVGRLTFDSLEDTFVVPEGAEEVELALDGKTVAKAKVK